MEPAALRAEFPVLQRIAYLNAGTDGPVPRAAVAAATAEIEREASEGRTHAHFERRSELQNLQREHYGALLGRPGSEIALTTSTSEGISRVIAGLDLGPGDEIITSDEEHPGLLGPLQSARDERGVEIRVVPFADLPGDVGRRTRLVATSHVSWINGRVVPAAAGDTSVPLLLDGAQGVGAVPAPVQDLGCDFYAGSGQKWLCGPDGTGFLWVRNERLHDLKVTTRSYVTYEDVSRGLDSPLHADARRLDTSSVPAEASAFALASLELLAGYGWDRVHRRASELAAQLADELRERGREVVDRDGTTLVAWRHDDAECEADSARLAAAGVAIRHLPGRGLMRASVGAWNDETDLDRLLQAL